MAEIAILPGGPTASDEHNAAGLNTRPHHQLESREQRADGWVQATFWNRLPCESPRTCYTSGMLLLGRTRLQAAGESLSIAAVLLALVLPVAQMPHSFAGATGQCVQSTLGDLDGRVAILPRHSNLPHAGWWRLDGADTTAALVTPACPLEPAAAAVRNADEPRSVNAPGSPLVSLHCLLTI